MKLLVTIRYKGEFQLVYNEINLGFCCLVIYTDETGIRTARLKSTTEEGYSDIVVPREEIYTEKVEE